MDMAVKKKITSLPLQGTEPRSSPYLVTILTELRRRTVSSLGTGFFINESISERF
jgi:hypothetical protein